MAFSNRPQEIPYEQQSVYALIVFALRLLYQLWPLWVLVMTTPQVGVWWSVYARSTMPATPVLAVWLAPFVEIAYAAAFIPVVFFLKRLSLATWNTLDAATAGAILTLAASTVLSFSRIDMQAGGLHALLYSAPFTQAMALFLLCFFLALAGYRGPWHRWVRDLVVPLVPDGAQPSSAVQAPAALPKIIGKIKTPQPSGLQDMDPEELARDLSARVIGQNAIATQLARAVSRRMAQQRRGKPVFTALFAGPTGVGKTEMAKAVAQSLPGNETALFRIDCGNVLGEAGLQTLIGAPTGYMGSDKPGALTAHVQRFPRAVILFDEIEKAMGQQGPQSPLFRLLLSLLDEGRFTEQSTGAAIDATGCVILMTSNAAHKALAAIYERYKDDAAALTRATKDELQAYFAPEFLARIDLVTTFSPLDNEARAQVIAMHAGRIARQYDLTLETMDAAIVSQALEQWQKLEGYGAREILRWLEDALADALIKARKQKTGARISLSIKDGIVVALPAPQKT